MVADLCGEINPGTSFSEDSVPGNVLGLARGERRIFQGIVDGFGERERTIKGRKDGLQRKKGS